MIVSDAVICIKSSLNYTLSDLQKWLLTMQSEYLGNFKDSQRQDKSISLS